MLKPSMDGFRVVCTFIRPDCELAGFGCEDARITLIGDTYCINSTAVSIRGITTAWPPRRILSMWISMAPSL